MKTLINFVKNLKTFYQFYRDYEYDGNDCRFIIENYQEVLCNKDNEQTYILCKKCYCSNG